jgi:protein phosphatase
LKPGMNLTVEVEGKTDVGCVRPNNEDNFGYDCRHGIFVVSDGMGGAAAGEVASKMAVDVVLDYLSRAADDPQRPPPDPRLKSGASLKPGASPRANALAEAIDLANRAIYEAAARNPAQAGMGATIVTVLVQDGAYSIAHVGDSRIYLLRPQAQTIRQLTNDHSLVMEQVRRGMITMEEAQASEVQNVILRSLGAEVTVEPDVDDLVAEKGDVLLLASDGLTRHVPDAEILRLTGAAPTMLAACDSLIQAAKDGGGHDNITCLLVRFVQRPWYRFWRENSRRQGSL